MQRTEKGKPSEKRRKKIRHKRKKRQDKKRRERKVNMTQTIEENRRYSNTGENIDNKTVGTWKYRKKIQLKGGGKEENEKEKKKALSQR
jgi:hypothetical protein